VTDGLAQHPEGRPQALLVGLDVVAEADVSCEERDLARGRGEGLEGLDAGGGPFAVGLEGHKLDG